MQSHRGKIQKKTMKPVTKSTFGGQCHSAGGQSFQNGRPGGSHEKKRQKLICIIGRETVP